MQKNLLENNRGINRRDNVGQAPPLLFLHQHFWPLFVVSTLVDTTIRAAPGITGPDRYRPSDILFPGR